MKTSLQKRIQRHVVIPRYQDLTHVLLHSLVLQKMGKLLQNVFYIAFPM